MKRTLDLTLGTLLLVLVLPMIVALAVVSAIALRAWPFFTQERVGFHGRMFRMTKIRTLPPRTPAYVSKYELHDVRVPRICQLMRNLHLDELPQLFLVPLGKMSLVGPRPEMAALHARLDPEFAALRTSVRPGCSGLWQIGRSSHRLIVEAPEYDRLYVENASIRLDLWVMWRTLCSFVGTGHVSLDALPVQRPPVSRPVAVPPIGIAPIIDLRESVDRGVPVRTTSAMPIAAVADA